MLFQNQANIVLPEKLSGAQWHPLRFSMAVQVVFTEIRTVVRSAIFSRDHHETPAEAFFTQGLRSGVACCTRADDDELSRIGEWVVSYHVGCTPIFCIVRHGHQNLF